MQARLWKTTAAAGAVAVVVAGLAAAAGPTPGFAQEGVPTRDGSLRYVARVSAGATFVKVVRYSDLRMIRSRTIRGEYGVPEVAYDGTAGGLTHDGKLLVLESAAGPKTTRFVVLSTRTLKPQQTITLRGTWGYDALSPDARTLYLIQILPADGGSFRYLVRAYDLAQHGLVTGAIADKSEPGAMTGLPMSRVESADGSWVYTLYQRTTPGGKPFIHALHASARVAVCIDLDWKGNPSDLGAVHLTLSPDETQIVVRRYTDGKALLTVAAPR
jgi:hypothetical protein